MDRLGKAVGAVHILREDRAGKAVDRIVGNLERLLLRVERNSGEHRSKNLLPRQAHIVGHIDEDAGQRHSNRRFPTQHPFSTKGAASTLPLAGGNHGKHLIHMLFSRSARRSAAEDRAGA